MSKQATVIGLGRLGLCFALTLEKAGYDVIGCDIIQDRVDAINDKTLESPEPGVSEAIQRSLNLMATTDLTDALNHSNMIFVTVRTDSLEDGKFDHSQADVLVDAIRARRESGKPKDLVICSNVMPGYSDSVQERLEAYNYSVSFNPELVAQGQILQDQAHPDMVIIGQPDEGCFLISSLPNEVKFSEESGDRIARVYRDICGDDVPIVRMNRISAELTKIALNCYLTTKITFANSVGDIAISAGANPDKIMEALGHDSRIGPKYLKYGYGYGGPCFPRDNDALVTFAKELGHGALISQSVVEENGYHLKYQVKAACKAQTCKSAPMILGPVSYKPGIPYLTESQQLKFAVKMAENGYRIIIQDSLEVLEQVKAIHGDLFEYMEG